MSKFPEETSMSEFDEDEEVESPWPTDDLIYVPSHLLKEVPVVVH